MYVHIPFEGQSHLKIQLQAGRARTSEQVSGSACVTHLRRLVGALRYTFVTPHRQAPQEVHRRRRQGEQKIMIIIIMNMPMPDKSNSFTFLESEVVLTDRGILGPVS